MIFTKSGLFLDKNSAQLFLLDLKSVYQKANTTMSFVNGIPPSSIYKLFANCNADKLFRSVAGIQNGFCRV